MQDVNVTFCYHFIIMKKMYALCIIVSMTDIEYWKLI